MSPFKKKLVPVGNGLNLELPYVVSLEPGMSGIYRSKVP